MEGIGEDLAGDLFNNNLDPALIEPLINEVLKLKMPDKKASLKINKLALLDKTSVSSKGQTWPARRVRIEFQLSTEEQPRIYEGMMVRQNSDDKTEKMIVSFARVRNDADALAFEPKLLNEFLDAL